MKTTLNAIRAQHPSPASWAKLLAYLGKTEADDEPLGMLTILDSNGPGDALWCLRAVQGHDAAICKLACDFALSVAHLWDMPPIVRQYLETQDESIRRDAADAAYAVYATRAAINAAANAAYAAYDAACAAINAACAAYAATLAADAAAYAACTAAYAATRAAYAAYDARTAYDAACAADAAVASAASARAAERTKQESMLRKMLEVKS
jgi:hypothetical protein